MDWLIATIKIGLAAAVATTFDDNIYLTAFFSSVNRTFRPQHVVVGELLGFTALVIVSLIGFLIGLVIPSTWIGLLGILPILIGLNNLRNLNQDDSNEDKSANLKINSKYRGFDSRKRSLWDVILGQTHLKYKNPLIARVLAFFNGAYFFINIHAQQGFQKSRAFALDVIRDPQTYRVSAVTVANGGNNLGIYIPLFATSSIQNLSIIIPVCYFIVLCWLLMSYNPSVRG